MKVTLDLENLASIIEEVLNKNINETVSNIVKDTVREEVDNVLKETIQETANSAIEGYVKDYLSSATVTVGDSWKGEKVEQYSVEDYLKIQISGIFERKSFIVFEKDRWGDTRKTSVSFQDYIDQHFDIDSLIKSHIDRMVSSMKEEVSRRARKLLDDSMKNALAENVFQIVSATETYRKISDGVKRIGGANE